MPYMDPMDMQRSGLDLYARNVEFQRVSQGAHKLVNGVMSSGPL